MIHGHPASTPRFAPHLEAGAPAAPAAAARPAVATVAPAKEETTLPVLSLLIAVAMFFAFGALAPVISAAVR